MNKLKEDDDHNFLDFAYKLYKSMNSNDINLIYEGLINHEITKTFTFMTEKSLAKEEESNMVQ